jgi:thimet oligopeptidase
MKIRTAALAAALLSAFAVHAAKPAKPAKSERPLAPVWSAEEITRTCEAGLARARKMVDAMHAKQGAGDIFGEWNRLQIAMEDVLNPVYLLSSVSPDKATRDAAEPCLSKYTTLGTELFQDELLFKRVQAAKPRTPHQVKLKRDLVEGFEDSGVALAPAKRARAKEIFERFEALRQEFDRRVREDPTRVTIGAAEMDGMPETYVKAHEGNRDKDGNYVLTLKYPDYVPFVTNAKSEDARKRYYTAKLREGGEDNLKTLQELYALRLELAKLYGLPSFADYALRRKMAGTPAAVRKFLDDVHGAVEKLEVQEIGVLREAKARETGNAEAKVNRWDVNYLQERVRKERYAIDQEKLRKYFPTDKAIDYTLLISQRLYGVRFEERKVPTWHQDVRYFDVVDAKTGEFISGFYLDLFPREGKYNHAAAFPIRGVSTLAHRTPLTALVANFDREGLDHGELETLMHEFGHVLHGVLSRAEYDPHAGTSVKQDFVEAPSQMFEEWARRPQALALMKDVCAQCPQLSGDEIARLESARRFGQGIRYARQWLYAAFDMELSTNPRPPLVVWKQLEAATPLGTVEGSLFPAGFSHLASGYAAGYYGYMWSEVLALDMLSPFKRDLLDQGTGRRYRQEILAQGGQREEAESVRRFLGREPSSEAFFQEITGKR